MGASVCTRDCFNCPFPDCVIDEMDAAERKAHRDMDKDLIADPEKKRIAAYQKAYYEANREEIAAYKKAYYEANREENLRFGQAIRQARKAHGLTQASLGRLLSVGATSVSRYESGELAAPRDKLTELFPELQEICMK